jgi:hypothetical protein
MQKGFATNNPPKTPGARVSCKTGTGVGGQRARQAQGWTSIEPHIHEARPVQG